MFNLHLICKVANALHKSGHSRSNSFLIAWSMVRGITTRVKGVARENRQAAIQHLLRYDQQDISIRLQREPENLYDHSAIAIVAAVRGHGAYKMGYLSHMVSAVIAPLIDAGEAIHSGFFGVKGGYLPGINYGLAIWIKI